MDISLQLFNVDYLLGSEVLSWQRFFIFRLVCFCFQTKKSKNQKNLDASLDADDAATPTDSPRGQRNAGSSRDSKLEDARIRVVPELPSSDSTWKPSRIGSALR